MTPTLLDQALELMLNGMGVVFIFLGVLVVATGLVSWLAHKFAPPAAAETGDEDRDLQQAAASAAVHHHRRKQS